MNKVAQSYLWAMAAVAAIFYIVRGVSFLVSQPPEVAGWLGWPALAMTVVCGAISYLGKTKQLSAWMIEAGFLVIWAVLVSQSFWSYYFTENTILLTNTAFVMIAVGLGTTRWQVWLAEILATLLVFWWFIVTFEVPLNSFARIVLVSGASLSLLAFVARIVVVKKRVELEVDLVEKAEKLEQANRAKDRFLANMTHELRTPLTGVMGMMDLMADTKLDKEQRFILENAQKSAGFLREIINDILDFSKLEAGKLELRPEPINLQDLTQETVGSFEHQANTKKLALKVSVPRGEPILVKADGLRVGQVLLNLISNAIKFTSEGSVSVSLEWQPQADGGYATFSVTDTGVGIAAEDAASLFHRFEQVDSSNTRTTTGTGLGLAICQELVQLMDGTLSVTSDLGVGSTFSFRVFFPHAQETMPMAEVSAVRKGDVADEFEEPEVEADGGVCVIRRALLAEDNKVNQTLIIHMLQLEGFEVTLAENGQQAVEAVDAAQTPFDMIFLDIQMPVMDGVSAARIIRLREQVPPPIIAITANTSEQDLLDYADAGIAAVLGKPLDRKLLQETVGTFLSAA